MSTKGIYSAVSGAVAQSQRLDTIANNIANVNTPGFKRDEQVFREYLTAAEKGPEVIQVPRVPASIESFYDMQGADRSLVEGNGTYIDHNQGALKETGNVLDLAIEGQGFFEVLTPEGVKFSRNGSFTLNPNGVLVTKEGYPVLRDGTGSPEQRLFQIQGRNVTVSFSGQVINDNNALGALSVVKPSEIDALQKVGSSLYKVKPNYEVTFQPADRFKVHQGYVEMSNVNVIKEMTDMIATTRMFESTQKAIQAFDKMDEKLVNTVPALR